MQLDTVVSERWRTEDGGEGQKTVRRLHSFNYSQRHRSFWSTVISAFIFFPLSSNIHQLGSESIHLPVYTVVSILIER